MSRAVTALPGGSLEGVARPNNPVVGRLARQSTVLFEENRGQFPPAVRFLARAAQYDFFVTQTGATVVLRNGLRRYALCLAVDGASPGRARGVSPEPGLVHYFRGGSSVTGASRYRRVHVDQISSGVDWTFYASGRDVEFDVLVGAYSGSRSIRFRYEGAERLRVAPSGHLVLETPVGLLVQRRPRVFQSFPDGRREIEASYRIEDGSVTVALAPHDTTRPLVIDPQLTYASYLGGSSADVAYGVTVDSTGAVYLTGDTQSANFPTQTGFQTDRPDWDTFVTRLHPSGSSLVYSTYLGGAGFDSARAIAVDSAGNAFLTGYTSSADFPTLAPYRADQPGYDAFLTKLAPAGNALVFSTYLGGSGADYGWDVAVDGSGSAYVTGYTHSTNFPVLNQFQSDPGDGNADGFVTRFAPEGNALVYSTYLGGNWWDEATAIAIDPSGNAYITGNTDSTDFPVVNPLYTDRARRDGFLTKLAPSGQTLVYSTYLGGGDHDEINDVAVDADGGVYLAGQTYSTDFPVVNPIVPEPGDRNADAFVAKLHPSGSGLLYATYLGGSGAEAGKALAVDASGSIHVAGWTNSLDFPVANSYQNSLGGALDGFVAKLSPSGTALAYSTYFGGSGSDQPQAAALDPAGQLLVVGMTNSKNLPTQAPYQSAPDSAGSDGFAIRFSDDASPSVQITIASVPGDRTFEVAGENCGAGTGYRSPRPFSWTPGAACAVTWTSPDSGGPGIRHAFTAWTDGSTANPRLMVAPTATNTYTAEFQTQYQLAMQANPPEGGEVTPVTGAWYNAGSVISVSAAPNACYSFAGWSPNVSDNAVTLHQPETVTGSFQNQTAPNVTAQFSIDAGGVRLNRATGRFVQTVTLRNHGAAVTALAFVFDGLSAGISLYQPAGTTGCAAPAAPYREVGSIAPNQSVTLTFEYVRAGGFTINYLPRLLGQGVR